ncbi:MAG: response regulator [Phormidesmis sp.]
MSLPSSQYIPHGHCYLWQTPLVALHMTSDLLIALSYFSIPLTLVYFVYKRKHLFPVRLLLLFGSFIFLCGLGHVFDVVTLWYPIYWTSGTVRAFTALVSGFTAVELTILLPQFLALHDVDSVNQRLEAEVHAQEITQRELEANQKVFRSAFYDIPIGMVLVSLDGLFQEANEAILNIVGYSKEELLALDFQSITYPDDLEADLELVNDLIANNRRYYRLEKRYFHKLGHIVPIELSVSLLRDSEDNPLLFIAHINDISEQKRVNASLKAASEAAEAASRAKSEFLAMMSHEIRTPMNAMLGMTELLGETELDNQQQDFVEVIRNSGKTLLTVINDILDFSKIESNNLELEEGRLDLHECIEDVLTLFTHQAESKGLALTSLIEPVRIPTVFKGDSVRMRQILSNLISNSIKFTDEGEISVRVNISKETLGEIKGEKLESGQLESGTDDSKLANFYRVRFSIEDTGIGIEPDKLANLFQPFKQADSSITRKYGGTGLGLSISKRLVEMMGGELWAESESTKGSTFHFSLLLESSGEPSRNLQVNPNIDLSGKRLLVVAANTNNRKYLLLQAESWNLEASTVESAAAALALLEGNQSGDDQPGDNQLGGNQPVDAIAIDDTLPDMDGIELALRIRNLSAYQEIPLVLLQCQSAGEKPLNELNVRTKLLRKPIRRSHFYDALVQLLLNKNSAMDNACGHSTDIQLVPTTKTANDQKPLRILLTEDIVLNQKVALHMLSTYGYEADVANNGEEALEALTHRTYDLIFMDVQMPCMDGLEATRRIRENPHIHQPYIVAMTAHAMQGDREECLSAGMDEYIRKPISKRDLFNALQKCPQLAEECSVISV